MNTPDILDAAADLIEERGWWAGVGTGPDGYCVVTALITLGDGNTDLYLDAHRAFSLFVDAPLVDGTGAQDVAAWNDAQTDAFQVTNALRKCAEALR